MKQLAWMPTSLVHTCLQWSPSCHMGARASIAQIALLHAAGDQGTEFVSKVLSLLLRCTRRHVDKVGGWSKRIYLNANLSCAHISAPQPKLAHAGKRQLAQVALLDAAGDKGHGDVTLDAVYTHPWRYKRQQPCHLPCPYNPS